MKLRKCEFREGFRGEFKRGWFHRWADDIHYDGEKSFAIVVAIIEGQEGSMFCVAPSNMKFIPSTLAEDLQL